MPKEPKNNTDLDRIYNKLEDHSEALTDIKVILAKQQKTLDYHVYRTDLNEENTELLRMEIKPVKQHVIVVNGLFKILGALSAVGGVVYITLKIISLFS